MNQDQRLNRIATLEDRVATHPQSLIDICALADAYAGCDRWHESVEAYKIAVALDPDNADLYNDLGTAYEEIDEAQLAEQAYRNAIAVCLEHSTTHFNLGSLLIDQGRVPEAIEAFDRCQRTSSDRDERSEARKELMLLRPEQLIGQRFGVRAVAYILDIFAVYALQLASIAGGAWMFRIIASFGDERVVLDQGSLNGILLIILLTLFSVLYFTLSEGWFGASLGKTFLSMRVLKTDGRPCDIKSAFIRELFRFIDGFFGGIPAANSMKWPLHQRLGDRAANTVVVSSKDSVIHNPRPWWRLLLASGVCLFFSTSAMGLALYVTNSSTSRNLPDLSEVVLTSQDFPGGFLDLSTDLLGIVPGQQIERYSSIESVFGSISPEPYEMIWGFTVLLANKADQDRFADQDSLLAGFKRMAVGKAHILEQAELLDLNPVGDAMTAMTMVIDVEGTDVRMDAVAFRRDVVGAVIFASYTNDELPIVPIDEAANKLDRHIIEALSANSDSLASNACRNRSIARIQGPIPNRTVAP
jgi:uncharacterized RDD family membrane protein YckC